MPIWKRVRPHTDGSSLSYNLPDLTTSSKNCVITFGKSLQPLPMLWRDRVPASRKNNSIKFKWHDRISVWLETITGHQGMNYCFFFLLKNTSISTPSLSEFDDRKLKIFIKDFHPPIFKKIKSQKLTISSRDLSSQRNKKSDAHRKNVSYKKKGRSTS